VDRERLSSLELAVAMPKGDRGDVLVEKLTELGVTRLVPLLTERTVVQPKASRIEALRRAVVEASKQCGRNVLMEVTDPISWRQYVTQADQPSERMLLHPSGGAMPGANTAAVIAIGPEGGWTEAEVQMGIAAGWQVCSLGVRILRIETAAIAVAARIPG
jgi:16S rRNA (uracil1498-N3)-methyltransferase